MKTYTKEELKTILDKHEKWLKDEEGGKIANLSYANLSYANLSSADLRFANLSFANLSFADLSSANLHSANLSYANLSYANLSYANLSYTNLSFANLSYANLRSANLSFADLHSADLSSASTDKRYIIISCIGSNKSSTTYCFDDDIIWCGCFKGTLTEFETQVKNTHANNTQYLKEYIGAINYIKSLKED
jgi:hypothetical protein